MAKNKLGITGRMRGLLGRWLRVRGWLGIRLSVRVRGWLARYTAWRGWLRVPGWLAVHGAL